MNARWRDIKFLLNQASEADLDKPAQVYSVLFKRTFDIRSLEHLDTLQSGSLNSPNAPLVAVIDNARS